MRQISLCVIFIMLAFVSGCVTTPVVNYGPENQQLKTKVDSLKAQIEQLKDENAQLRVQLQKTLATRQEVRMPNAAEIQTALKKAGIYRGPIDGQIGTQTKESIKKFQQQNNINPDGVVGSRTWQLLSEYLKK